MGLKWVVNGYVYGRCKEFSTQGVIEIERKQDGFLANDETDFFHDFRRGEGDSFTYLCIYFHT